MPSPRARKNHRRPRHHQPRTWSWSSSRQAISIRVGRLVHWLQPDPWDLGGRRRLEVLGDQSGRLGQLHRCHPCRLGGQQARSLLVGLEGRLPQLGQSRRAHPSHQCRTWYPVGQLDLLGPAGLLLPWRRDRLSVRTKSSLHLRPVARLDWLVARATLNRLGARRRLPRNWRLRAKHHGIPSRADLADRLVRSPPLRPVFLARLAGPVGQCLL